jgi:hypothetical protein
MSGEFESIVRPFQNNNVTPSQTYYKPGQIGVPNVVLRIGRGGGGGKSLSGSYQITITSYCTQYESEKSRDVGD